MTDEPEETYVLQCGCGSITFFQHTDGENPPLECTECGDMAENDLAKVNYKHLQEMDDVTIKRAVPEEVSDLAQERLARAVKEEGALAAIVINEDGSVRTWSKPLANNKWFLDRMAEAANLIC